MNEDQAKVLLKKSALKTTEDFTDSLMVQIDAKSINHIQPGFPSVKRVLSIITLVVVLASALLFCVDFKFLSELEIVGGVHRTKLFAVVLFSVLLGINHVLKLHYSLKYTLSN
ncbi:hypothetical protein ACEZ3G_16470 [Maribacter algicola]|uniref:Uncharacterized protein n=1 Tax=Meishania litoralis TaxID=3434685 RepID=A0ACC7LMR3_9FLAO